MNTPNSNGPLGSFAKSIDNMEAFLSLRMNYDPKEDYNSLLEKSKADAKERKAQKKKELYKSR